MNPFRKPEDGSGSPHLKALAVSGNYRPPFPLFELARARLLEFFREPEAVFWVYLFPPLLAIALGIAFRNPAAERYRVAIVAGPDAAQWMEQLTKRTTSSALNERPIARSARDEENAVDSSPDDGLEFEPRLVDEREAMRLLRSGKVSLVVRAPADGSDQRRGTEGAPRAEYVYDPSNPEGRLAQRMVDDRLQRRSGRRDAFEPTRREVTQPGARYIDFLVPGLIGASLMGGGLWGVGFVTIDLRVRNLLKRFVTTPMRKWHFLGGLMLSRFFFMVTEVCVLLAFTRWAFGVRVAGSLLTLAFLVILGAWTFAGIGLLVASRAKTLEAASGLINLVMMPMYILSGIFFSADRFPEVARPWIALLPLTALIDAFRGVMLEGASIAALGGEIGVLALWSCVSFVLAMRWFRWM